MPPRPRPTFTPETVDLSLQQIHLLDPSSTSENLEQLGPIIKQVSGARNLEAYLKCLNTLIDSKDAEIEQICGENYQDFVSSVSTLLTVRQYTHNLQDKITTLDGSVSSVGKGLLTKKKELLQLKTTSSNLDQAIDALQACLRVLDVVNRVGEMVKEGMFWSALRSLDEIQNLPPSTLSPTPFFTHLLTSIPSLRIQIKDAVTASNKSWLLEIRNVSGQVGKLALETMDSRCRRWRAKQEKDPLLKSSRIGSAVELSSNEGKEVDVLNNDKLRVDFKPLYQCIHIYSALDSLEELQRSYHADRKAQSTLILPTRLALSSLPSLVQEIAGFFIVESHVIATTRNFRSEREVEELWEEAIRRVSEGIKDVLRSETDPEIFVAVKECLTGFSLTMEGYGYSVQSLHASMLSLTGQYIGVLQGQSGQALDQMVAKDELVPMKFANSDEKEQILKIVWLTKQDVDDVTKQPLTQAAPWSQSFSLSCAEIRRFCLQFYKYVEGIQQHHRDVDDMVAKTLDKLLTAHVSSALSTRLRTTQQCQKWKCLFQHLGSAIKVTLSR